MLARNPRMLVAITHVNRMARSIWATPKNDEDYRGPVATAV